MITGFNVFTAQIFNFKTQFTQRSSREIFCDGLEYSIQVLSPNLALVKHLKYYKVYRCKNFR